MAIHNDGRQVTTISYESMFKACLKAQEQRCHVIQGWNTFKDKKSSIIIVGLLVNRRGNVLIFDDGTKIANRTGFKWIVKYDFTVSILKDQSSLNVPLDVSLF